MTMCAVWQSTKPRSLSSPYPCPSPVPGDPADYTFKVLVIGDTCVGKTSFIGRFCENGFRTDNSATIGLDSKQKLIDVDGKKVRLQVWDTAGQERFRTLTTAYYRGAMGILILYDVTRETSFNHVTSWLDDLAHNASTDICKILVGNKCDFEDSQVVTSKRAERLAESFEFPVYEASAKTGHNVDQTFQKLARQMMESLDKKMSTSRSLECPFSPLKLERFTKKKNAFTTCSC